MYTFVNIGRFYPLVEGKKNPGNRDLKNLTFVLDKTATKFSLVLYFPPINNWRTSKFFY